MSWNRNLVSVAYFSSFYGNFSVPKLLGMSVSCEKYIKKRKEMIYGPLRCIYCTNDKMFWWFEEKNIGVKMTNMS